MVEQGEHPGRNEAGSHVRASSQQSVDIKTGIAEDGKHSCRDLHS